MLVSSACSGGTTVTATCGVPGRVQPCACPDGTGQQSCQISGVWNTCACDAASLIAGPSGGKAGNPGNGTGNGGSAAAGTGGGQSGTGGQSGSGAGSGAGAIDAGSDGAVDQDAAPVGPQIYDGCVRTEDCGPGLTCALNPFSGGGGFMGGGGTGTSRKGYCTKACTTSMECPPPPDGNAIPACGKASATGPNVCVLACASGQTCPGVLQCAGGICF